MPTGTWSRIPEQKPRWPEPLQTVGLQCRTLPPPQEAVPATAKPPAGLRSRGGPRHMPPAPESSSPPSSSAAVPSRSFRFLPPPPLAWPLAAPSSCSSSSPPDSSLLPCMCSCSCSWWWSWQPGTCSSVGQRTAQHSVPAQRSSAASVLQDTGTGPSSGRRRRVLRRQRSLPPHTMPCAAPAPARRALSRGRLVLCSTVAHAMHRMRISTAHPAAAALLLWPLLPSAHHVSEALILQAAHLRARQRSAAQRSTEHEAAASENWDGLHRVRGKVGPATPVQPSCAPHSSFCWLLRC